ncbi:DUF6361 family protein [uncultured Rubinisphaera sp.]|uniref:DUF6361 family protein n=1 Tax=uncultured Rubinisphaera sp. TaxID=1678686 RepID=UPI0026D9053F
MEPQLGWTLLSRDAMRRVETQLREDLEGVREEIGLLALHQAYADRFFPGTSVLHTRLRYVFFVPWMYEKIARHHPRQHVADVLPEEALALTLRLPHPMRGPGSRKHERNITQFTQSSPAFPRLRKLESAGSALFTSDQCVVATV